MHVDEPESPTATQAEHVLYSELSRVRRFATMLCDRTSVIQLTAYERELEAQLKRTVSGTDVARQALRKMIDGRETAKHRHRSASRVG